MQNSIEKSVIPRGSEYFLVNEVFIPLEKWNQNKVIRKEIIGHFKNGQLILRNFEELKDSLQDKIKIMNTQDKIGYIDKISKIDNQIHVIGCAADIEQKILPKKVLIKYDSKIVTIARIGLQRFDVAKIFNSPSIKDCGFAGNFIIDSNFNHKKLEVIFIYNDKLGKRIPMGSGVLKEWRN